LRNNFEKDAEDVDWDPYPEFDLVVVPPSAQTKPGSQEQRLNVPSTDRPVDALTAQESRESAERLEKEYWRTKNPWKAVMAVKEWNEAYESKRAILFTLMIEKNEPKFSPKEFAAFCCTVGSAYLRVGHLNTALHRAEISIELSPDDFRPHRVAGAALAKLGEQSRADYHFMMADQLKAQARAHKKSRS
jgi:Flp pilus assembly protein TadD